MEWKIWGKFVLTPYEVIKDGLVVVEDDKIIDVGRFEELNNKYPRYDLFNASDKIVMPGLINTHTHIAMSLLRSFADDMTLMEWLNKKIWPVEEHLTAEDVYVGSLLSVLEMIKSGTTTFNDMYFYMDQVAKAAIEGGIRGFLSRGLIELHDKERAERSLKEGLDFALKYNGAGNGLIRTMLGPHAPYTCSPDFLEKIRDISIEKNIPIHIHLAETKSEVDNIDNMYDVHLKEKNIGVIEYMDSLSLFDAKVVAAHCVWLNDKEIKILASKGVGVAHNPVSNMKLASGVAPVHKMLKFGVNVGIGTDGPASNNTQDMLRDMKVTALLHKVSTLDSTVVPANEVIKMATVYGSKVLFDPSIGEIAPKKKADLITLSLNKPHLKPTHDIQSLIVYSANGEDVSDVFVDGKLIMENRKVLTLNEERVLSLAEKHAKDLVERAGAT